jgi:hypothetical protein
MRPARVAGARLPVRGGLRRGDPVAGPLLPDVPAADGDVTMDAVAARVAEDRQALLARLDTLVPRCLAVGRGQTAGALLRLRDAIEAAGYGDIRRQQARYHRWMDRVDERLTPLH